MTIPSRPAPAPPGAVIRTQNAAAADANASLEQLRLQLQQQHQQQQQSGNGCLQKISIKLPPPPKGPNQSGSFQTAKKQQNYSNNIFNNNGFGDSNSSSITRKFPQARYAPSTNWNDSPFATANNTINTTTNGNSNQNYNKKVPPPRPPPPRVQANGVRKANAPTPPPSQGSNIITNIFNRKKTTATASKTAAAQNRVYGLSSGHTNINSISNSSNNNINANTDWNAAWNTTSTKYVSTTAFSTSTSTTSSTNAAAGDAQLISFDSPPSSPTFTQKSNSDCVSVDSFSSDSNFSSPQNGSVSQPESGFEDDFSSGLGAASTATRSRPQTTSPLDPWETLDAYSATDSAAAYGTTTTTNIGTAPVRNMSSQQQRYLISAQQQDNPLCNGKSLLPPTQSLTMPTIIKPKISQKPKAPKPPPLFSKPTYLTNSELLTPPSPPMPHCAPPPPPASLMAAPSGGGISLLDVISGKVDAIHLSSGSSGYIGEIETPYGIALYDFDGVEEGDLTFSENDKIYLLSQESEEWYRGRTRAGCEGIFPINYIDIKVPLEDTGAVAPTVAPATATNHLHQKTIAPTQSMSVRCLYNFPAEVRGDLALRENELVTILYKINEDWLYGEVAGRQGQFPSNFLEYVPENIPMP